MLVQARGVYVDRIVDRDVEIIGHLRADFARGCICLLCISVLARRRGPGGRSELESLGGGGGRKYIFPAEGDPAFAAVDVPNSVVPGGHLTVAWLAFNNIDAVCKISMQHSL